VNGRLQTISLPPSGSGMAYTFTYDGAGKLDYITDPGNRILQATVSGATLTQLTDPDTRTVSFGYDGDQRLTSRTNRRLAVTSLQYGSGLRVTRFDAPLSSQSDLATTTFTNWDELGLAIGDAGSLTAANPAVVFTHMDGPRTDVTDATRFWLDRWGAPVRVETDALGVGYNTWFTRGNATFPALVTRVQHPNGKVAGAVYDSRGNLQSLTDSSTYIGGQYATTTYEWDPKWDFVTRITPPEGDFSLMAYDQSNGNRLWQEDARGSATRVNFSYWTTGAKTGLLRFVDPPLTAAHEYDYDATRANLWRALTPLGFETLTYQDALGRDTLTVSPIDGSNTQKQRVTFDSMNRVTATSSIGPSLSYWIDLVGNQTVPAETLFVDNQYDEEGNLTSVVRYQQDLLGASDYGYDLADRRTRERHENRRDSTVYDAAGNPVRQITARGDTIRLTYDVLNRLIQRVVPQVNYAQTLCAEHDISIPECPSWWVFPYYPNDGGTGLLIPADTARFWYNVMGQVDSAHNRYAKIRRTYNVNGTLGTDSLRLRRYDNFSGSLWTTHVYGLSLSYDRNGRRTGVTYPSNLAPAGAQPVAYTYATHGPLGTVRSVLGNVYRFTYDAQNRQDSLVFPGGGLTRLIYDADGRLAKRSESTSMVGLHVDTLSYDRRGRITTSTTQPGGSMGTTVANYYSGLGTLAASDVSFSGSGHRNTEEFRASGTGGVTWKRSQGSTVDPEYDYSYDPGEQLRKIVARPPSPLPSGWEPDTTYNKYDAAGGVRHNGWRMDLAAGRWMRAAGSYYGADQRLMVHQSYNDSSSTRRGAFEEYWYDALGRRVLVRRRLESPLCLAANYCYSTIERFVWDGDQLLAEIRHPGGTGEPNLDQAPTAGGTPYQQYGRVVYTQGPGVDAPVDAIRMEYSGTTKLLRPHANWRGTYDAATDSTGAQFGCTPTWYSGCADMGWTTEYKSYMDGPQVTAAPEWFGSLLRDKRDMSGLMYMRNRYYDPNSGKFTQEDPIGLAGGLNLYGYANGDPVNFSDPFGLCEDPADPKCKGLVQEAVDAGRAAVADAVNSAVETLGAIGSALQDAAEGVGDFAHRVLFENSCPDCVTGVPPAVSLGRPFIGNAISGFTKHGMDQVINRGVSPAALLDAARNGTTRGPLVDQLGRESLRIKGRVAEFAINLLGRVTSAWRK
jgi:RHS repeat-associated protein